MSSDDYLSDLRDLVERASAALLDAPPPSSTPSPHAVLNTLIDATALYQQRLETALDQDHLIFDAVPDDWAESQPSEHTDWPALVTLWWMYASRFVRSLAAVPAASRRRPTDRHNLHETLWRPVPADAPATLDDLGRDFEAHLRHHLGLLSVQADVPSSRDGR